MPGFLDTANCPTAWIDTHCHLADSAFDHDRSSLLSALADHHLHCLIVPSYAASGFAAVARLCQQHAVCKPAYGIHPLFVSQAQKSDLLELRRYLQQGQAVAVGEIGLDRHGSPRSPHDEALQNDWLIEQLKLAQEFDLPVLLHVRRAIDAVLQALRRYPVVGGIAHAFNGSRQQADEFIKRGFKLGFGGALTYPGARRIRALAASLPLDSLVLETDAPDMSPLWLQGRRNSPLELPRIAAVLAELRGITPGELASQTTRNVREVLKLERFSLD